MTENIDIHDPLLPESPSELPEPPSELLESPSELQKSIIKPDDYKDLPKSQTTPIDPYKIYKDKALDKGVMLVSKKINDISVNSVAFHPSGELLATGSTDKTATLWKIKKHSFLGALPYYDMKSVATLNKHTKEVRSVAFHPTKLILATGSLDQKVIMWKIIKEGFISSSYKTIILYELSMQYMVESVAFNLNGGLLATCGSKEFVQLWYNQKCVATLHGQSGDFFRSVAFHPTAPVLATCSSDNTAKLWLLDEKNLSMSKSDVTLKGHTNVVNTVAFHPSGELLATGSWDGTAKVWRLSSDNSSDNSSAICVDTLQGHSGFVNSVAFHPSGELLATGSWDGTAKLWRLSSDNSSATCVATSYFISSVNSVSFHPTKLFLVTGESNGYIKLWDIKKLESGAQKKKYELSQETGLSGGSIIRHHKKRLSRKLKRYASKRIKKNRNRNKYKKSKKVKTKTKTRRYRKFR